MWIRKSSCDESTFPKSDLSASELLMVGGKKKGMLHLFLYWGLLQYDCTIKRHTHKNSSVVSRPDYRGKKGWNKGPTWNTNFPQEQHRLSEAVRINDKLWEYSLWCGSSRAPSVSIKKRSIKLARSFTSDLNWVVWKSSPTWFFFGFGLLL